jgi:acyl carrier protein
MHIQVLEVIKESLSVILSEDVIDGAMNSSNLIEEGFIDSFGVFELAAHLESNLDIVIPTEHLDPESFSSIKKLEALCVGLLKEKSK